MKEKRSYKRFELIPVLAMIGCVAVLLFECIFIFERYELFSLPGSISAGRLAPSAEIQKPDPAVPPPERLPVSNPSAEPVQSPPAG